MESTKYDIIELKKKKKNDGLNPQGGGVSAKIRFIFFFTFTKSTIHVIPSFHDVFLVRETPGLDN